MGQTRYLLLVWPICYGEELLFVILGVKFYKQEDRAHFADFLIFFRFSIGLHWILQKRLRSSESLKYCVSNLLECHLGLPLKITVFSNSDSKTTFYYSFFKCCVISHWMNEPKNHRKCELPRFIGSKVACPIPPAYKLKKGIWPPSLSSPTPL